MRRRGPTPEDAELWRQVASTVEPLRRRRRRKPPRRMAADPAPEPAAPPAAPAAISAVVSAAPAVRSPPAPPRRPAVPPIVAIDRRERREVMRGTQAIEARIDLHGLRQDEAHGALAGFLALSQSRGHRFVLVITGKGGEPTGPIGLERGVLRRLVPHWLRGPEWRSLVLGFEPAHRGHGGDGALYVRLRRSRGGGL